MKIRTGFVSNSSSSSFAITLTAEDYEATLASIPAEARKIIEQCGKPQYKALGGVKLAMVYGHYGDSKDLFNTVTDYLDCPDVEDFNEDGPWGRYYWLDNFIKELKKHPHLFCTGWA